MELPQGPDISSFGYGEDSKTIVREESKGKAIEHLFNSAQNIVGEMIFGTDEESREIKKLGAMSMRELVEY